MSVSPTPPPKCCPSSLAGSAVSAVPAVVVVVVGVAAAVEPVSEPGQLAASGDFVSAGSVADVVAADVVAAVAVGIAGKGGQVREFQREEENLDHLLLLLVEEELLLLLGCLQLGDRRLRIPASRCYHRGQFLKWAKLFYSYSTLYKNPARFKIGGPFISFKPSQVCRSECQTRIISTAGGLGRFARVVQKSCQDGTGTCAPPPCPPCPPPRSPPAYLISS